MPTKINAERLSDSQRRALRYFVSKCEFSDNFEVSIDQTALDILCKILLADSRWNNIWSVEDFSELLFHSRLQRKIREKVPCGTDPHSKATLNSLKELLFDALCENIESYPREYFVYLELPGLYEKKEWQETIVLSDSIALINTTVPSTQHEEIIRPTECDFEKINFATTFEEMQKALRPISMFLLEPNSIYIRIREKGYLSSLTHSKSEQALLTSATTKFKIFLYYTLERGLLESRRYIYPWEQERINNRRALVHTAIHGVTDGEQGVATLPSELEEFTKSIVIREKEDKNWELSILGRENGIAQYIQFLELLEHDEQATRIAAGIEWLLDSLLTKNETLALLQSCIGLEAILGDNGSSSFEQGMTARLAERYAYLLGKNSATRAHLRDEFRNIFVKRGDLIHARRNKLSLSDRWVVSKAQEMLQTLIRKEFSLMMNLPDDWLYFMDITREFS